MNKNKNELRQHLRMQRKSLSLEKQQNAAQQIFTHAIHLNRYRLSQHIAFYLSFDGEINPESILLHAHQAGKKCYLPTLHPRQIGTLSFFAYTPGDPVVVNRFGILEPEIDPNQPSFPAWQLEIVFTPLVAFDEKRNRLGMGKGFYDRTFAFLNDTSAHKPYLIGLAYQMQRVECLNFEAHDVRLDTIITEDGVY
jgi:5-formyltetrahydrofolate cyclo-ligase